MTCHYSENKKKKIIHILSQILNEFGRQNKKECEFNSSINIMLTINISR